LYLTDIKQSFPASVLSEIQSLLIRKLHGSDA